MRGQTEYIMMRPSARHTRARQTSRRIPSHLKDQLGQSVAPKTSFVPYWDPESYIRDLKLNGHDTTEIERLHKEHPPVDELVFTAKKPFDINTQPLEKLQAKYKNKKPPLDERIKALHEAGYPDEVLIDVMKKDAKRVAEYAKIDDFIFAIFGDANEKKASSAKKKSIHQILKIKKRTYAVPDPTEDENPVEDDLCEGDDI